MGVGTRRIIVRNFIPGEAAELRRVFMSSVHGLAGRFYTETQINAFFRSSYVELTKSLQKLGVF